MTLIERYRAIEAASEQLLDAARRSDWDEFERLQSACNALIEQVRAQARTEQPQAPESAEKTLILKRILGNDAEIRTLAEPWLSKLDSLRNAASLLHPLDDGP